MQRIDYIGAMKPIRYEKAAAKSLRRMQRQVAQRIAEKVAAWVADPAALIGT
jgi:hypothetical protein